MIESVFFTTFDKLLMKREGRMFFSFSEDVEIFSIQVLKKRMRKEKVNKKEERKNKISL